MNVKTLVTVVVLGVILFAPLAAQDDSGQDTGRDPNLLAQILGIDVSELETTQVEVEAKRNRFELFNECVEMRLVIEHLSDDAADIDLTKERIQTLAESRLRAARLYEAVAAAYLYVRIGVAGNAFSTEVSFHKRVHDPATDLRLPVPTWSTGSLGTHGQEASFIMQGLSEHLDKFVLEYLRVNEKSC